MVSVQGARHVLYYDDNVVLAFVSIGSIVLLVFGLCMFGVPDALELAAHVVLLGLVRIGEKLMDLSDVDEGPGEVVSLADGLDPCALRW